MAARSSEQCAQSHRTVFKLKNVENAVREGNGMELNFDNVLK